MRSIDYIVIHCTATSGGTRVENILKYWKNRLGWKNPGYHFIIETTGKIHQLQPLDKPTNGVSGYNANSIHISYVGGIDMWNNQPKDTRTPNQKNAMEGLIKALHGVYGKAKIQGHRDFPNVAKACPSFDVNTYLKEIGL